MDSGSLNTLGNVATSSLFFEFSAAPWAFCPVINNLLVLNPIPELFTVLLPFWNIVFLGCCDWLIFLQLLCLFIYHFNLEYFSLFFPFLADLNMLL